MGIRARGRAAPRRDSDRHLRAAGAPPRDRRLRRDGSPRYGLSAALLHGRVRTNAIARGRNDPPDLRNRRVLGGDGRAGAQGKRAAGRRLLADPRRDGEQRRQGDRRRCVADALHVGAPGLGRRGRRGVEHSRSGASGAEAGHRPSFRLHRHALRVADSDGHDRVRARLLLRRGSKVALLRPALGDERQPPLDPRQPGASRWVGPVHCRSSLAGARLRRGRAAARNHLPARPVRSEAALALHPRSDRDACRDSSRARTRLLGTVADGLDRVRQLAGRRGPASPHGVPRPRAAGGARLSAADHSVVLYDQDCGFCKWSLDKILAWDRSKRLRAVPIQSEEGERLLAGMDSEERLDSWHFVGNEG
ncbi:MAG: DUF393 domain-containing protein, partial [Actinobacteria bacterium]